MPIHSFDLPRGRLEHIEIESAAIANNSTGTPMKVRGSVAWT